MSDAVMVKNTILVFMSTIASFFATTLGGWDASLKVLIALMVVDYITGVLVAFIWQKSNKTESGALSSKAGFKGLCKKGTIILIVWISTLLDSAMASSYVRSAVIFFFIGNEGISLLENAGLMGVPYPDFLKRALQALRDKGDDGEN